MGRDRKFQAILPFGGKILNTERARLDKIIEFEGLKNLIIALGMGIGESINMEKLRYHRVIIMTDADVDGEHIETLVLTFFFRHLPEIIKQGYLYIAQPPLYKIQAGKDIHYAYTEEEKDEITKGITTKNITLQRYKGLGEMNPQQLWDTTMNPENRVLKQITMGDAEETDAVFTMLMGDEVPPRKHFIQTNAKLANLDI
jgi:DNA gyrase subunit B